MILNKLKLYFISLLVVAIIAEQTTYALILLSSVTIIFAKELVEGVRNEKSILILIVPLIIASFIGRPGKDYFRDMLFLASSIFIYALGVGLGKKITIEFALQNIKKYSYILAVFFIIWYIVHVIFNNGSAFDLSKYLLRDILPLAIFTTFYITSVKKIFGEKIVFFIVLAISGSRILIIDALIVLNKSRLIRKFLIPIIIVGIVIILVIGGGGEFGLLYKINNSINEIGATDYDDFEDISLNWRGYESFLAINQFMRGSIFNMIFGQGLGARVELNFEMELAGTIYDAIPVLHNGYLYVLIKEGFFGLMSFILFFYLMFKKITNKKNNQVNKELGIIILIIIPINAFVVGGVMQTGGLIFMFILGLLNRTADSSTRCNKDEPGNGWLRMPRHHGRLNRQVQVARCTSTSAEKNDTKFTAS